MRILAKITVILLAIVLVLWLLIECAIYTRIGVKIAAPLLQKYLPALQIEQVSGTLANLHLQGVRYDTPGTKVYVKQADLTFSGNCLLRARVCVKNAIVDSIVVNVDTSQYPPKPKDDAGQRKTADTPIGIVLRDVKFKQIEVNVDDMQFGAQSLAGSASWIGHQITFEPTDIQQLRALFSHRKAKKVQQEVVKKPLIALHQKMLNFFNKPLLTSLPQVNIPVDITVKQLTGDGWWLHLGGDYYFEHVLIQGDTDNDKINLQTLQTDAKNDFQDANVALNGKIQLGAQWPIDAKLQLKNIATTKKAKPAFRIDSQLQGELLGIVYFKSKASGSNDADLDLAINLVKNSMPAQLQLKAKHLQWPLLGKAQYQLDRASLYLKKPKQDYLLQGNGFFSGDELPSTDFVLDVKSNGQQLNINKLQAKFNQGQINVDGALYWPDQNIHWDTYLQLQQIDLTKDLPNFPLQLHGAMRFKGRYDDQRDDHWSAEIEQAKVDGRAKNAPLHITGDLKLNAAPSNNKTANYTLDAKQFALNWGDNKVVLDGDKTATARAHLNLAQLSLFDPRLSGSITGLVQANHQLNSGSANLDLQLKAFGFGDALSINQGHLSGKIAYPQQHLSADLALQLNRLSYGDQLSFSQVTAKLTGTDAQHQLSVMAEGKPLSANLQAKGKLDLEQGFWRGEVTQAAIQTPNKPITLDRKLPLVMNWQQPRYLIGAHCWNNGGSLCLQEQVNLAQADHAKIKLSQFDLSQLNSFFEGQTSLSGILSGQADVQWQKDYGFPSIKAAVNGNQVVVNQYVNSQTLPIHFSDLQLNADLNQQQAKFNWQFGLGESGRIKGNILVLQPSTAKQLQGSINIDRLSLAMINPLLDKEGKASGEINSALKLSGSLNDPILNGYLKLQQSTIQAKQLPADIQSIALDMRFLGKRSTLNGTIHTQEGEVVLEGDADWRNLDDWRAKLAIKGDGVVIAVPSLVTMKMVPNVTIEANQEQLELRGRVDIPKARITIEDLPKSVVNVSSDEVMLDNQLQEISPRSLPFKVNSHLMLNIGDDVVLAGYGLNANLQGKLFVQQSKRGLGLNGQITIPQGRFHAYAQDLVIRKGELTFAGPVDEPQINLEAIRNPSAIADNVVAGLRVTGEIKDPKVEIFSEPSMSQQEALSYLLRGEGLENGDQTENDMMTAVLIGLGTSQGGKLLGNVGELFGIRDLAVDTQGVGDNSQVVVSGYILPNLQVKYGVGIFDSLATFTIRYRLMPRLYLEAVTGLAQSLDLLYHFEF